MFENCTVDASIFVKIKTLSLVGPSGSAWWVWFLVSAVLLFVVEVFKGTGWMPWH